MWCTTQEQDSNGLLAMLNLNTGGDKVRQTEPQNINFMFLYQLKKKTLTHTSRQKHAKDVVRVSVHPSILSVISAGETVPPIYN